MKRYYTKSEVKKNRKKLNNWSNALISVGFVFILLVSGTNDFNKISLTAAIVGVVLMTLGTVGQVVLDRTGKSYSRFY